MGDANSSGGKPSVISRLRPQPSFRPMLEKATATIRIHIAKMDEILRRLQDRDARLYRRMVGSLHTDRKHATILANELVELRKIAKMVTQTKFALESIALRVETIKDLGDIAVSVAPAVSAVRQIQPILTGMMPEAESSLSSVGGVLSEILVDAGRSGGITLNFDAANADAQKILAEAAVVAEERIKQRFPAIPFQIEPAAEPLAE